MQSSSSASKERFIVDLVGLASTVAYPTWYFISYQVTHTRGFISELVVFFSEQTRSKLRASIAQTPEPDVLTVRWTVNTLTREA